MHRYIIHAGHQLNAKEFCYLRTVRVTAAINWNYWIIILFYNIGQMTDLILH